MTDLAKLLCDNNANETHFPMGEDTPTPCLDCERLARALSGKVLVIDSLTDEQCRQLYLLLGKTYCGEQEFAEDVRAALRRLGEVDG